MRFVFRTDGSLDIGTGHVMRCLTLAGALREKGAICYFICRELSGNLIARIREAGFGVTVLTSGGSNGQGASETALLPAHAAWLGEKAGERMPKKRAPHFNR